MEAHHFGAPSLIISYICNNLVIVRVMHFTRLSEVKSASKELENLKADFISLANETSSVAEELMKSRQISVSRITWLVDYTSKIKNCPECLLTGIERAAGYSAEIQNEWQKYTCPESDVNNKNNGLGVGLGGAAVGAATAALGPSAAMAIATTFGTASTGVAISTLAGAAGTNAALAWLGGGAVAVGGGGMAGGAAILALFGPVGIAAAIGSAVAGGFIFSKKNKENLAKIDEQINVLKTYIAQLKDSQQRIMDLKYQTDVRNTSIMDFINSSSTYSNDYRDVNYPKRSLFDIIDVAKLLGKMLKERINYYQNGD